MHKNYPHLFSKGKLGTQTTKNRIVLSPMGDNMANTDGSLSDQSVAYYTERAKGGAGVIICGVVSVDYPRGKTIACQHRLDAVKYVKGWEILAREIHRYGALLIPQIHHAGMATDMQTTEGVVPVRVSDPVEETSDKTQLGSHVDEDYDVSKLQCKTLTIDEIKELERKFIQTAIFAQMAECDGVELHGISYLLCQFFTKGVNNRTDEYGGSLENRIRFAVNIIKGIRRECGPNFIIGIRMPVHKWSTDGFTDEESQQMAKAFEAAGCDFIDANGGYPPTITALLETQRYEQGDRVHLAQKIKEAVKIPVFAVGMLREPDFCEQVLAKGYADYVMLGRALLADPYWPHKAQANKTAEIRRCISCLDSCYGNLAKNQSIRCVINPAVGYESQLAKEKPALSQKKVVVVGGGIAGMQAAITAADRGHKVILLEETDRLGGQLNIACAPPYKHYIQWATDWFIDEVGRKYVAVQYNCKADLNHIKFINPDVVFLGTGSRPWVPNIDGIENGVQSWDILSGKEIAPENKNIVVIGGGTVGCETALLLSRKGNTVTILEMMDNIATGLEMANKLDMLKEFEELGISVEIDARVQKLSADEVVYEKAGSTELLKTDYIVLALGQKPYCTNLADQLEEEGIPVVIIGDAKKPSKIAHATNTGFFAALNL